MRVRLALRGASSRLLAVLPGVARRRLPGVGRRTAIVLLVAAATGVAARVAASSHATHYRFSAAAVCGVERWTVKTLQDRPKLLRRQNTTVAHLISVAKP